jgi:hypothetical protein
MFRETQELPGGRSPPDSFLPACHRGPRYSTKAPLGEPSDGGQGHPLGNWRQSSSAVIASAVVSTQSIRSSSVVTDVPGQVLLSLTGNGSWPQPDDPRRRPLGYKPSLLLLGLKTAPCGGFPLTEKAAET